MLSVLKTGIDFHDCQTDVATALREGEQLMDRYDSILNMTNLIQ